MAPRRCSESSGHCTIERLEHAADGLSQTLQDRGLTPRHPEWRRERDADIDDVACEKGLQHHFGGPGKHRMRRRVIRMGRRDQKRLPVQVTFQRGNPEFRRPADRRHWSPMRPAVFLSHATICESAVASASSANKRAFSETERPFAAEAARAAACQGTAVCTTQKIAAAV